LVTAGLGLLTRCGGADALDGSSLPLGDLGGSTGHTYAAFLVGQASPLGGEAVTLPQPSPLRRDLVSDCPCLLGLSAG
jgi:hypothetical protein